MKARSIVLATLVITLTGAGSSPAANIRFYIGTYTGGKSQGIYTSFLDEKTGKLTTPMLAAETRNPSFLAMHPSKNILYSVGEMPNLGQTPGGAVSAFAINKVTGRLKLLNQQSSGGGGPCHLAVDRSGRCVMVANYGGGSVAAFPIRRNGSLGPAGSFIQHAGPGAGVDAKRQAGPHAHFILPDAKNERALVCDLGLDKVLVYQLNPKKAELTHNKFPFGQLAPGAGPRHLDLSKDGKTAYVINELECSIASMRYEQDTGKLSILHKVNTLPTGYTNKSTCAEIALHPNQKFVYGSNRGHDSIAVFATDTETGEMTLVEHESTRGQTPRHFAISPSGRWLLAENQNSNSIHVFSVDSRTGSLSPTEHSLEVGAPVCIVFAR